MLLQLLEVRRQAALLREHAEGVVAAAKSKLDANEAVLAGLSSFLHAADQNATAAVTRYVAAISAAYPHIYMLEVARRMTAELRASDTLARYGGDEFMGLLESVASVEDAEKVADKLIDQFHELVITRTGPIRVSISIGIALCPQHGNNLDDLKTAADSAMYQVKKAGKNRSHSFKHLHAV